MLFFAFLALVAFASADLQDATIRAMFDDWKIQHEKNYQNTKEHNYRLSVFAKHARFVHNWDEKARGFKVGLNAFADLTNQEFRAIYNGMNITRTHRAVVSHTKVVAPSQQDWRKHGAVTPIKNQGQCGSCWAFSTTGSVEGAWKIQGKKALTSLSEQNLVDCSTAQGNMGCNGGLMDQAFQYIISNKGIDTEKSYPYTATGPNQCQYKPSTIGATISSFTDVASGDENALMNAVSNQPVSVAIDASQESFQLYQSGVYYEPACSSTQLDHGVLAVGYDSTGGQAYWIVKNSWGTGWGNQGYIWMSRNRNNNCGIATAASYPHF